MVGKGLISSAAICALGAVVVAAPAKAAVGPGFLPAAVAASAFAPRQACPAGLVPATGSARQELAAPASKMAALLGGAPSRLEKISQQQAAPTLAVAEASFVSTLEPAAGPSFGIVTRTRTCSVPMAMASNLALPQERQGATTSGATARLPLSREDFLASRRVAIGHTSFDGAWDRVRQAGLPRGIARDLLSASQAAPGKAVLAAVNSWANARIRYVEDRELYGQADFWASASETLRRRAGDCEDIAIAKMQVLAAMGVPREAMYLTLARDLVRGSDHAMLVVRLEDRSWLLDNSTDQLLDASESYDYRPIMSFSVGNKWLHGY